jgi:hypothetical protein
MQGTRGHGDDSATSTHGSYDDATAAMSIRQDSWGEPVYAISVARTMVVCQLERGQLRKACSPRGHEKMMP